MEAAQTSSLARYLPPASWFTREHLTSLVPAHVWPEAIRMTIAAVIAFLLAELLHLHSAYWSVIATLMTTRGAAGNGGRSLWVVIAERVFGMLLGMATGATVAEGRTWHIPEPALIAVTILGLGVVVGTFRKFQMSPMIAIMVLSTGAAFTATVHAAEARMTEIALGATVGIVVTAVMLRREGRASAMHHAARAMEAVARMMLLLSSADRRAMRQAMRLRETIRSELRLSAAADQSFGRKKTASGDRLATALPKLVADISTLGRAVAEARIRGNLPTASDMGGTPFDSVIEGFAGACGGYARHLEHGETPPSLFDLDASLEALRRNLVHPEQHGNDEACMALPFLMGRLFADLSDIIPAK